MDIYIKKKKKKKETWMNKIDEIRNWILNLPICIQKTNPWWENGSCLSPHINTVSFNQFIINYDQYCIRLINLFYHYDPNLNREITHSQ